MAFNAYEHPPLLGKGSGTNLDLPEMSRLPHCKYTSSILKVIPLYIFAALCHTFRDPSLKTLDGYFLSPDFGKKIPVAFLANITHQEPDVDWEDYTYWREDDHQVSTQP